MDGSASYGFGDNIVSYKWSEKGTQVVTGEWLEAECGTLGSLWNVETETYASKDGMNEEYATCKKIIKN